MKCPHDRHEGPGFLDHHVRHIGSIGRRALSAIIDACAASPEMGVLAGMGGFALSNREKETQ
jgi:hypothetical protein